MRIPRESFPPVSPSRPQSEHPQVGWGRGESAPLKYFRESEGSPPEPGHHGHGSTHEPPNFCEGSGGRWRTLPAPFLPEQPPESVHLGENPGFFCRNFLLRSLLRNGQQPASGFPLPTRRGLAPQRVGGGLRAARDLHGPLPAAPRASHLLPRPGAPPRAAPGPRNSPIGTKAQTNETTRGFGGGGWGGLGGRDRRGAGWGGADHLEHDPRPP